MTQSFEQLQQKGVEAFQGGRTVEAADFFARAAALNPAHAPAHNNLGVALAALGRMREALASYARALEIKPDYADAHFNRGIASYDVGELANARASYDAALALTPGAADILSARGDVLRRLGLLEAARADFSQALSLQPDRAAFHNNMGVVLKQSGDLAAARESFARAVAREPRLAEAHYNLGNVLADLKRSDQALASYDAALALSPKHAAALNNRGNVLRSLKRHSEAAEAYTRAIAAGPAFAEAYINRGAAAADLGRAAEALADYNKAAALNPGNADAHHSRGVALCALGRHAEAEASLRVAIALNPDHAEAHWALAVCLLQQGDFARGWPLYEGRWKVANLKLEPRNFPAPLWQGEDIAGRSILLHGEQGLGDAIQFCRYAPLVAARDARVILEVAAPLVPLLQGLAEQFVAKGDALPAFDLHCPLLSLPRAFATTLATVPPSGYLNADADKQKAWAKRLGPRKRPRIGISWSGNPKHNMDLQRSIALTAFSNLLLPGADYVSLQKDERPEDEAFLTARPDIRRFADELYDFSDTAALCAEMDLVITVDTSVAHLAGALNKPVWILLASNPDWRWLLERSDSPWYPSAALYRQENPGDWSDVFARVQADFKRLFLA